MKGKFARTIAVIATGSLLAVASDGTAVASPVGGHGSSSTEAAFAEVLKQRDDPTKDRLRR